MFRSLIIMAWQGLRKKHNCCSTAMALLTYYLGSWMATLLLSLEGNLPKGNFQWFSGWYFLCWISLDRCWKMIYILEISASAGSVMVFGDVFFIWWFSFWCSCSCLNRWQTVMTLGMLVKTTICGVTALLATVPFVSA